MSTIFLVTLNGSPAYVTTTEEEANEWKAHEIRHRESERIPIVGIYELEPATCAPPITAWFVSLEQNKSINEEA